MLLQLQRTLALLLIQDGSQDTAGLGFQGNLISRLSNLNPIHAPMHVS